MTPDELLVLLVQHRVVKDTLSQDSWHCLADGCDRWWLSSEEALAHIADLIREQWRLTPITATERLAQAIFEGLAHDSAEEPMPPWDQLTDEQRRPFFVSARDLGYVFPDRYPKIVAEMRGES